MTLELVQLNSKVHNRDAFDCGNESLNVFLKRQAGQASKRDLSRTMVLVDSESPSQIIGFHTLVYGETSQTPVQSRLYKAYPNPLPALTLARIAVDSGSQGHRYGEQLLLDTIRRTALAHEIAAPVIGLFTDAKNEKIKSFYQKYGFEVVNGDADPLYLWLPIGTCQQVHKAMG